MECTERSGHFRPGAPVVAVHPRHRLDICVRDLLLGLAWCLRAPRRSVAEVARLFPPAEDALVTLSVRSGFDLLLEALAEPPGGEVLVSAVTHPDMVRIIEERGLRAVPVDLDPVTLDVRREHLAEALTPRTRMVLVAHLFGGRSSLGAVAAFARGHRLVLVEDCAQTFRGPHDPGDPLADVSMFSFGALKTASAVGGAVLRVRDPGLLEKMRRLQRSWPVQSRRSYAGRLLKMLCLVLLCRPLPYGLLVRACSVLGRDLDAEHLVSLYGGEAGELPRYAARSPGALERGHRAGCPQRSLALMERLLAGCVVPAYQHPYRLLARRVVGVGQDRLFLSGESAS